VKTSIYFKKYIKGDLLLKKEICYYDNNSLRYYLNDVYHRQDGPAVRFSNGEQYWFLNGTRYYCENEYWEAVRIIQNKKKKNIK